MSINRSPIKNMPPRFFTNFQTPNRNTTDQIKNVNSFVHPIPKVHITFRNKLTLSIVKLLGISSLVDETRKYEIAVLDQKKRLIPLQDSGDTVISYLSANGVSKIMEIIPFETKSSLVTKLKEII